MFEEALREQLTDEEYKEIIEKYGNLSNYIKEETFECKKEITKEQDKIKMIFFTSLVTGVSVAEFNKIVKKRMTNLEETLEQESNKGYKQVIKRVSGENQQKELPITDDIKSGLDKLYKQFEVDKKSTKRADDKFYRIITNYYKSSKKTYEKPWVTKDSYVKGLVSKYDKVEKVVRYNRKKKDGTYVYFDIASYNSMVYNTNLTNTGIKETIKDASIREWDVAYIDPHMNSCPLCQEFQGHFISLTGGSLGEIFNGQLITETLDSVMRQGLFHPHCTHVPRKAYPEDRVSNKWSSPYDVEQYETKQKINALELKKSRLKNDLKIYNYLNEEDEVDNTKQKIRDINAKIRDLST